MVSTQRKHNKIFKYHPFSVPFPSLRSRHVLHFGYFRPCRANTLPFLPPAFCIVWSVSPRPSCCLRCSCCSPLQPCLAYLVLLLLLLLHRSLVTQTRLRLLCLPLVKLMQYRTPLPSYPLPAPLVHPPQLALVFLASNSRSRQRVFLGRPHLLSQQPPQIFLPNPLNQQVLQIFLVRLLHLLSQQLLQIYLAKLPLLTSQQLLQVFLVKLPHLRSQPQQLQISLVNLRLPNQQPPQTSLVNHLHPRIPSFHLSLSLRALALVSSAI